MPYVLYFPFAYTQTLKPLGLNVHDPDFLVQRKRHVIRHLLGEEGVSITLTIVSRIAV